MHSLLLHVHVCSCRGLSYAVQSTIQVTRVAIESFCLTKSSTVQDFLLAWLTVAVVGRLAVGDYNQAVSCRESNVHPFVVEYAKLKQSQLFERGGIYGIE